jgi:cell division protein ZapA
MAKADITLRGRAYAIACSPGQEGRIVQLSHELDERVRQIAASVGDVGEERLLLIASLSLLDELDAARRGDAPPPPPDTRTADALALATSRIEAIVRRLEDGL